MRLVRLDFADPAFPASLVDAPEPELPRGDWARVAVAVGGICGSDMHLFKRTTGPAPLLTRYVAFPMDLGHEIAGTVVEAGPDCPVPVGTQVAVDPVIGCEARGITPYCPKCASGASSACTNIASRVTTPGMGLGFTSGLGGGWAEQVAAHHSQLHPLPAGVALDAASLHEPLSIAVHGLLRQPPAPGEPILVVGAGIIGLAAVAAATALFPSSATTVLARYPHQAAAARRLGAGTVVDATGDAAMFEALAELVGTSVVKVGDQAMLTGGFPYVVEAVGSAASVTEALRSADSRGTVLLLGAAGVSEVDLSPVFLKELALVGSFCHAVDAGPGSGPDAHSIDRALAILADGGLPADVMITHRFALDDVREAVRVAGARDEGAIKVVLHP